MGQLRFDAKISTLVQIAKMKAPLRLFGVHRRHISAVRWDLLSGVSTTVRFRESLLFVANLRRFRQKVGPTPRKNEKDFRDPPKIARHLLSVSEQLLRVRCLLRKVLSRIRMDGWGTTPFRRAAG